MFWQVGELKMKHLKKINCIVLPLAIWVTMIFYHGIVLKLFSDFMMNISAPFVLSIALHTLVQLLIICALTVTAVKKLGYKIKYLIISVALMYVLFAIWSPPSTYMFVFTGGVQIGFASGQPAMPFWLASLFITVQYGIVMLITTLIACRKNKADDAS